MNRRSFVASAAASVAAPFVNGQARKPRNVLFIASDDLNNCLSCYGHPLVKTPNIDRIAKMGVRFDRAYCQFPLCSPSRASLMTGTGPDYTGIYDLQTDFRNNIPDVVTLGQLFQKNGYLSARVGKIYHYGVPSQIGTPGLDDPRSWNVALNPAGVDHTKEEPLVTNHTPKQKLGSAVAFHISDAPDSEHTDGMTAARVSELLSENRNRPFFLAAGFYRPHVPWIAPSTYFDMFPLSQMEPIRLVEGEMKIAPEIAYWVKQANWGMSEAQMKDALRAYYASIAFLDVQVGKLLDQLDRLRLTDNTTVVFWSDHGYALGDHGQWMKQQLFERVARVPMLIGGAGVEARGKASGRTVELMDIYPTLAEVCDLKATPSTLQGKSLAPLLRDASAPWDKPAITQVARGGPNQPRRMGYSIRDERYRYTMWENGELGEELYDYETDPRELKNFAHEASYDAARVRLRKQLVGIIARRRRT